MDALQEFIDELTQHDVDLTSTLRKAKALTSDLHSPELDEWLDWELYGYSDPQKVPRYRRFSAASYGNFAGPNEGTAEGLLIPMDDLPPQVKEFAEDLVMVDGIGALQAHGAKDDTREWPPDLVMLAQEATALKGGLFLIKAYQPIPASVYPDILEQVRNRLFDFLLNLRNNNPASEESNGSEAVGRLVNYHIYGGQNVIATGEQVNQQVSIVRKDDATSLLDYLRKQGVGEEDLRELNDAIAEEPEATPTGTFGARVGAWLGGMVDKAATGVWDVGLEVAAKTLPEALKSYYGI